MKNIGTSNGCLDFKGILDEDLNKDTLVNNNEFDEMLYRYLLLSEESL